MGVGKWQFLRAWAYAAHAPQCPRCDRRGKSKVCLERPPVEMGLICSLLASGAKEVSPSKEKSLREDAEESQM
ncbi:hypothetical protein AAFF_G00211690 [Aldrovandia affinis]|uniref:Uncharacterized protein n=1 Tax=Aldrovandia affinis TaxID=143900 RepID=A0AAD7WV33_9TELE|nr:hypothetical protein AAFF_G00211690 [Aldrovandia affinis]